MIWLMAGQWSSMCRGTFLATAVARYPNHLIVRIDAPPEMIAKRLKSRGREDAVEVSARLLRKAAPIPAGARIVTISNDTTVQAAGDRVITLLQALQAEERSLADAID